jgi:hypothetical protein
MLLSTALHWNRPGQWPRKIRSTMAYSAPSARGSHHRNPGGLRKILPMAMTVSKKRSINGSPQRDIEGISCSPKRLASASPAQKARFLIAPIGQWRSLVNMSHRQQLQASERRGQPKAKRLFSLAGHESSASAFDPLHLRKTLPRLAAVTNIRPRRSQREVNLPLAKLPIAPARTRRKAALQHRVNGLPAKSCHFTGNQDAIAAASSAPSPRNKTLIR